MGHRKVGKGKTSPRSTWYLPRKKDVKRGKGEVRATMMPPNPSTWEIDSKIGTPRNIGPSVMPRTQYSTRQKVKAVANAVADKTAPLTKKAVNWVFTGSMDGVRRGQWARQPAQQQQRAPSPRRQPRQRVVYVQPQVRPPRQHEEQDNSPVGDYWGWGSSRKGKKSSGGWGGGWGNK